MNAIDQIYTLLNDKDKNRIFKQLESGWNTTAFQRVLLTVALQSIVSQFYGRHIDISTKIDQLSDNNVTSIISGYRKIEHCTDLLSDTYETILYFDDDGVQSAIQLVEPWDLVGECVGCDLCC